MAHRSDQPGRSVFEHEAPIAKADLQRGDLFLAQQAARAVDRGELGRQRGGQGREHGLAVHPDVVSVAAKAGRDHVEVVFVRHRFGLLPARIGFLVMLPRGRDCRVRVSPAVDGVMTREACNADAISADRSPMCRRPHQPAGGLAERCMSMLLIGLLIALAAAVFAGVVLAEDWGGASYAIHGFGHHLGNLTLAGIFLAGIIITTIFFFALYMASISGRMRRRASARRRAEHRSLREEHEGIVAERDRLARELDAERASRPAANGNVYPTEPVYPREDAAGYPAYRNDVAAEEEARRHPV